MDRRLQRRYVKLVKAQMSSSTRTAAGPANLPETAEAATATQAVWRFFNNARIKLPALVEPLREAGRQGCARSPAKFALLAHDWCKLDYGTHRSKRDRRQLTHEHDIGYELTTALLIDAHSGAPLAPLELHLRTAAKVHSTAPKPPAVSDHHLDQLQPTMDRVGSWQLPRRVVHIIDREADSLGHYRQWAATGHCFLVRSDDRRVRWNDESWLLSEIVADFDRECRFQDVREVRYHGRIARQEVAQAEVVLDRPHTTRRGGKQRKVPGPALPLRLVMSRIVDEAGRILAEWTLLTNVPAASADAGRIALWYYWRWRIESFYKLLKSHGQEIEYWQQETGAAIARRLLVAAMACVVVWNLQRQTAPEAEEIKRTLVRLSGRQMKYGTTSTAPALLAGYFVLLSMTAFLEHHPYDLRQLKALARDAVSLFDTS
jgi:hypothetical protein